MNPTSARDRLPLHCAQIYDTIKGRISELGLVKPMASCNIDSEDLVTVISALYRDSILGGFMIDAKISLNQCELKTLGDYTPKEPDIIKTLRNATPAYLKSTSLKNILLSAYQEVRRNDRNIEGHDIRSRCKTEEAYIAFVQEIATCILFHWRPRKDFYEFLPVEILAEAKPSQEACTNYFSDFNVGIHKYYSRKFAWEQGGEVVKITPDDISIVAKIEQLTELFFSPPKAKPPATFQIDFSKIISQT